MDRNYAISEILVVRISRQYALKLAVKVLLVLEIPVSSYCKPDVSPELIPGYANKSVIVEIRY